MVTLRNLQHPPPPPHTPSPPYQTSRDRGPRRSVHTLKSEEEEEEEEVEEEEEEEEQQQQNEDFLARSIPNIVRVAISNTWDPLPFPLPI